MSLRLLLRTLSWLPRVQFAAAAVAAQVDDGWEESVRREALYSLLHGPMDWATEAAIRALTYHGCQYEPIAPDIHEAFQLMADHRPDLGHRCGGQAPQPVGNLGVEVNAWQFRP